MVEEEETRDGNEEEAPQEADAVLDIDQLKAELEEAQRERGQYHNLLLRVQADSVNYKRRVEEEREELQQRANAVLVLQLLPTLDDFERAIQHAPDDDALRPWAEGVEMVYNKLKGILESFGVTRIEALGMGFDPYEHEALLREFADGIPEGKVVSVVREGYKLMGRVLRPAQVTVSKGRAEEPPGGEPEDPSEKETQ